MGINLIGPGGSSSTAYLIADSVSVPNAGKDGTATLTKANGRPVSAALEIQSTLGGLLLPRMTMAQINALNAVNGMQAFNSTLGTVTTFNNGTWTTDGGSFTTAIVLTPANIVAMNGAAILIVAAPAAGFVILVNQLYLDYTFNTAAYTTGGAIALQYGAGAYSAADAASASIAATAVTAGANNIALAGGSTNIPSANAIGIGLYLSNATAAFANPGTAAGTLAVSVSYSIVPAV